LTQRRKIPPAEATGLPMIYADFNSTAESGGVWCLWVPGDADEIAPFRNNLAVGIEIPGASL